MHLFSPILQLVLLAYLPFSLAAGPKALSDIFEVDTRSASTHPGSCLRLEDPSKPDSLPLYDPYAGAGSVDNLLNNMYVQIYYSVVNTLFNINSKSYNKENEVAQSVRRLVGSLIGVTPRNRGDDEAEFEPAAGSLDSRKLEEIRGLYRAVKATLEEEEANGEGKPKLFCDSDYMEFQTADSFALDKRGNKIAKRGKNAGYFTLKEWETAMGRDFDEFWYFWANAGTVKGYMVFRKSKFPALSVTQQWPFPLDLNTNQPSLCQNDAHLGFTFAQTVPEQLDGTDAWATDYQIILCPNSFKETSYRKHGPSQGAKEVGAHLDNQAITALTWFHELFHLVNPADSPDHEVQFPKMDADGKRHQNWPEKKSAFDEHRSSSNVYGALQSMTLALYDNADPETTKFEDLLAVRSPENLAWLSWGIMVTLLTGQDWATGTALPRDTQDQSVTAVIPGEKNGRRSELDSFLGGVSSDDLWHLIKREKHGGSAANVSTVIVF